MDSSQKKFIGSLGIALVVLILFILLVVLPLVGKIKQLAQEYLVNQEILTKLDQREYLFKDWEKDYQEKQDQLLMIEKIFLSQEEVVSFISTLEDVAQQTGNVFEIKKAQSYTSPVEENGEIFLSLQISLQGSFNNLLLFLANLENSPYPPYRLLEIDKLSVSQLKQGDLNTTLEVKVFTQ